MNDGAGIINADVTGGALMFDTGNTVVNYGLLEAEYGGTLDVHDAVIGFGSALIAGGTIQFDSAASIDVTFDNGAGGHYLRRSDPDRPVAV